MLYVSSFIGLKIIEQLNKFEGACTNAKVFILNAYVLAYIFCARALVLVQ